MTGVARLLEQARSRSRKNRRSGTQSSSSSLDFLPCSPVEQGLWLAERTAEAGAYNLAIVLRCPVNTDLQRLRDVVDHLESKHPSLGLYFPDGGGFPVRRHRRAQLSQFDILSASEDSVEDLEHEYIVAPFDLANGPLARLRCYRIGETHIEVVIVVHHIIADARSLDILVEDIHELYSERGPHKTADRSIGDFLAAWQNWLASADAHSVLERYTEHINRPPDRIAFCPAVPASVVPSRVSHEYYALTNRAWVAAARQRGVTPFVYALAAFVAAIRRISGAERMVVAIPGSLRGEFGPDQHVVGNMVSTVLLFVDLHGVVTFLEALARVSDAWGEANRARRIPLQSILGQTPGKAVAHDVVEFQLMFGWQKLNEHSAAAGGAGFERIRRERQSAVCDVAVEVVESKKSEPILTCEYNVANIARSTIEALIAEMLDILDRSSSANIDSDVVLTPEASPSPGETTAPSTGIIDRFLAVAQASPEVAAIETGSAVRSYGDLFAVAVWIAARIQEQGVKAGDIVAIEESPDHVDSVIAVVLGAWMARACVMIVPHDAGQNEREAIARLACMVAVSVGPDDSIKCHLRADQSIRHHRLPWDGPSGIDVSSIRMVLPQDLAYLVLTSGSTGSMRAVAVHHGAVAETVRGWSIIFGNLALRHAQPTRPSFDVFYGNLLRALCFGGTVVICDRRVTGLGIGLSRFLVEHRIDVLETVPQVMRTLRAAWEDGEAIPGLRIAIVGSDVWRDDEFGALRRLLGRDCRLFNTYGTSETAIDSTYFEYKGQPVVEGRTTIGKPFPGTSLSIIDSSWRPVINHEVGELILGGPAVTRGYLGDPEATASRFISLDGERLVFRTGDRVWRTPTGDICFEGRNDNQLSIGGVRIEAEHVESVVATLPEVRDVAVVGRTMPLGGTSLVIFVTAVADLPSIAAKVRVTVREHFRPPPPIAAVMLIGEIPVLPNGKIDRHALRQVLPSTLPLEGSETIPDPPSTQTERSVAEEMMVVLGVSGPLRRSDTLIALGGSSFAAAILHYRLSSRFGKRLEFGTFNGHSSIENIAGYIERPIADNIAAARQAFHLFLQDSTWRSPRRVSTKAFGSPRTILMTGGTGKLGSVLLRHLADCDIDNIIAVTRKIEPGYRVKRVSIEHVQTDLKTIPSQGLPETWRSAGPQCAVVHAGCSVNFVSDYPQLRGTNVAPLQHLLNDAIVQNRPFHFLSSASIEGFRAIRDVKGGYNQSKWAGEALCTAAAAAGLPVFVYRLPHVIDARRDNCLPTDDFFWSFVKASIAVGMLPDVPARFDPIDVESQARAISDVVVNSRTSGGLSVLRLVNPRSVDMHGLSDLLGTAESEVAVVSPGKWISAVTERGNADPLFPLAPFADLVSRTDTVKGVFDPTVLRRDARRAPMDIPGLPSAAALIQRELAALRLRGWL